MIKEKTPQFGFNLVDGELVRNESEQALIAAVTKMRKAGLSYKAVAIELERKGFSQKEKK